MKITKEDLNRMIQEELDSFMDMDEELDLTLEEEDDDMDMDEPMGEPMDDETGMNDNEDLMSSLRNLFDVLKDMFGEEAEEGTDDEEMMEIVDDEDDKMESYKLNESVSVERFKKLANIRG
jgi:hypothetical protein